MNLVVKLISIFDCCLALKIEDIKSNAEQEDVR